MVTDTKRTLQFFTSCTRRTRKKKSCTKKNKKVWSGGTEAATLTRRSSNFITSSTVCMYVYTHLDKLSPGPFWWRWRQFYNGQSVGIRFLGHRCCINLASICLQCVGMKVFLVQFEDLLSFHCQSRWSLWL